MNARHFLLLLAWTCVVMAATGALLFFFAFGDCGDDAACRHAGNASRLVILATGFGVYWLVAIRFFLRWAA